MYCAGGARRCLLQPWLEREILASKAQPHVEGKGSKVRLVTYPQSVASPRPLGQRVRLSS